MDERKRDSMVAYLRRRMQEFGIKPEDLASAIASEQLKHAEARYRSATGDTWNGEGEMPQWLQQATSAGQSITHFEVSSKEASSKAEPPQKKREKVDWRNDPFAGSPLARQGHLF